jgi:hypothetical protein
MRRQPIMRIWEYDIGQKALRTDPARFNWHILRSTTSSLSLPDGRIVFVQPRQR